MRGVMRGTGKLVDTWMFKYNGVSAPVDSAEHEEGEPRPKPIVKGQVVRVEVRILKRTDDDEAPRETKGVQFEVTCDAPKLRLVGTDIEALRKAVWEQCDDTYKIRWESWFLVDLAHSAPYEGLGTGMEFSYKRIERGYAWDGTSLMRERWGLREDRISVWPDVFTDREGHVKACLQGTPEIEAALEEFSDRINALRKKLATFLSPKDIYQTLTTLRQATFLPPLEDRRADTPAQSEGAALPSSEAR